MQESEEGSTGKVWKIFVVDDDESVARVVRRVLDIRLKEQVSITLFLDPVEALKAMHVSVDILITDYQMPKMDGPALIASSRQVAPHLRVLLMSGNEGSFARLTQVAAQYPTIDTIAKPFTPDTLTEKIKALMST